MLYLLKTRRLQIILLTHMGMMVAYALRVNISVAVLPMVEELGFTPSQKGLILGTRPRDTRPRAPRAGHSSSGY